MTIGRPLIRVAETTSTMDLAMQFALRGASSGTVVLAGHQTSGRGRSGRAWDAPPWSSLLLSIISHSARDPRSLGLLSLLLGVAVADTVHAMTGQAPSIKWPNDVLVNGRKIAGILVLNKALPGLNGPCLITGIGLNVNTSASDLPETGTSLAIETGHAPGLDDVLGILLANLSEIVDRFERDDTAQLMARVNHLLAYRGELVFVEDGARVLEGRIQGVDFLGALILETTAGETLRVVAGELTRGPRQVG
jgi:BirA family transcriptional regulator, biotin operon repressor / biotin---[acetyl-CoA-carboxylase] ligase